MKKMPGGLQSSKWFPQPSGFYLVVQGGAQVPAITGKIIGGERGNKWNFLEALHSTSV